MDLATKKKVRTCVCVYVCVWLCRGEGVYVCMCVCVCIFLSTFRSLTCLQLPPIQSPPPFPIPSLPPPPPTHHTTPLHCLPQVLDLSKVKHFILDECDRLLAELDMRRDVQTIFMATPHEKQVRHSIALPCYACPALPCHAMSYSVWSCHTTPYYVMSYHVMSYHVITYHDSAID